MVKEVNGILDQVESGDIGALLKKAPNWGDLKSSILDMCAEAPSAVDDDDEANYPLYFHVRTTHEGVLRDLATSSYGLA